MMSALLDALQAPPFQALGWALVHFLWQGMLLALVFRALLGALRRSTPQVRYLAACAGLFLMAATPVVGTVLALRAPVAVGPAAAHGAAGPAGSASVPEATLSSPGAGPAAAPRPSLPDARAEESGVRGWVERAEAGVRPWLPVLVLVWLLGVGLGAARMAGAWLHLRRLRTRWLCEVPAEWAATLARLCRQMGIDRPVRVLGSTRIDGPAVIGALKPVILIPASLVSGLSPRDVELIMTHELAHVRRWDYVVNLAQAMVETLLFFHPAIWWLSEVIRDEREKCCDDLVVSVAGGGRRYARALLAAEELRATGPGPRLAPALGGGSLYRRIQRIVVPAEETPSAGGAPLGACLAVLAAAVLTLGGARNVAALDGPRPAEEVPAAAPLPSPGDLGERWAEARVRAAASGWSGYWIAWGIPAAAPGGTPGSNSDRDRPVAGTPDPLLARLARGRDVERLGPEPGPTDVVFLFRMPAAGDSVPSVMKIRTAEVRADLDGAPLVWLGAAPYEESLGMIARLYGAAAPEVRAELAAGAALHAPGDAPLGFVRRVLEGDPSETVRAEAAYWLHHQPTPAALALLERTARGDDSADVREEAVTGIARMGTPAAREVLARLERDAPHLEVRREAGDWLMRGPSIP